MTSLVLVAQPGTGRGRGSIKNRGNESKIEEEIKQESERGKKMRSQSENSDVNCIYFQKAITFCNLVSCIGCKHDRRNNLFAQDIVRTQNDPISNRETREAKNNSRSVSQFPQFCLSCHFHLTRHFYSKRAINFSMVSAHNYNSKAKENSARI